MKTLLLTFFILLSSSAFTEESLEFHEAIKSNDLQKIRIILDSGASLSEPIKIKDGFLKDDYDFPPHRAIFYKKPEVLALFFKYNLDPNTLISVGPYTEPILFWTIFNRCLDCVKITVKAGGDIHWKKEAAGQAINYLDVANLYSAFEIATYLHDELSLKPTL